MDYIAILPPGKWRTLEDEAQWATILEWRATVAQLYQQHTYLTLTDPRFSARMANAAYRARIEREHKKKCDNVEEAALSLLKRSYLPDGGWKPDFELEWVPADRL